MFCSFFTKSVCFWRCKAYLACACERCSSSQAVAISIPRLKAGSTYQESLPCISRSTACGVTGIPRAVNSAIWRGGYRTVFNSAGQRIFINIKFTFTQIRFISSISWHNRSFLKVNIRALPLWGRALRCKSSLRCGLYAAIPNARNRVAINFLRESNSTPL